MSNRVIKDSIWSSPSLAKLPVDAQLHWPRLLLMADDWGCFNADLDVILGLVYPKMKGMTLKKVEALLKVYFEAGMLFLWQDRGDDDEEDATTETVPAPALACPRRRAKQQRHRR